MNGLPFDINVWISRKHFHNSEVGQLGCSPGLVVVCPDSASVSYRSPHYSQHWYLQCMYTDCTPVTTYLLLYTCTHYYRTISNIHVYQNSTSQTWLFMEIFCRFNCTMLSSCRCRIRTLIQSISCISFFSIYIHLYPHKTAYRHGKNVPLHFWTIDI